MNAAWFTPFMTQDTLKLHWCYQALNCAKDIEASNLQTKIMYGPQLKIFFVINRLMIEVLVYLALGLQALISCHFFYLGS